MTNRRTSGPFTRGFVGELKLGAFDELETGSGCFTHTVTCSSSISNIMELSDTVDGPDISYLHKKFKKVAEISSPIKADVKYVNGHGIDGKQEQDELAGANSARYICPYCQLVCAKPSVLQKHIRAHTNERPYPCAPCGFAFKTKSNLYKHCRSQSHRVKTGLGESCVSGESDFSDDSNHSGPKADHFKTGVEQPRIYKPKFHKAAALFTDPAVTLTGEESVSPPSNKAKLPSPASEMLHERISRIIRDNQVIFETVEPQFSKKFLQRQNSREKDDNSPKSEVETRKLSETKSKLALALQKSDRTDRSNSPLSYPKVNSDTLTYQPLNLTKKSNVSSGGSVIKEILIASRDSEAKPERLAQLLNTIQVEPSHHAQQPLPERDCDVGPLLGNTPLVDSPTVKKRRVQSTVVPPDLRCIPSASAAHRRLSTSSLPSTLRSLEELSRHPMKQPSGHMVGGEVKILDGSDARPSRSEAASEVEDGRVMLVAKPGLHVSGGTLVSAAAPAFHMANILSPDTSGLTLAPNVVTPNLTVPGAPAPQVGILTIMHGERRIPFVPGIPGPQSLLSEPRGREPKPQLSSTTANLKISSSSVTPQTVPNDVPKVEISSPSPEEKLTPRKFLRPTSLPLKPGSFTPKRLHQGTTPTVLSLVSPETPRPKKSYGQLFLNGHAYTYLGLKCSTRSYYCTISRPQPMYVVQSPQHSRLSMYSNWKVHPQTDPLGLTPGQAIGLYDSRYRTDGYTTADSTKRNKTGGIVHSSVWRSYDKLQEDSECEPDKKKQKICSGGYESLDEYTYIRGRGRGRFVCEECGIRCNKPSMLKKHIRTHSDLRPYTCQHCAFAFKTKGNLTKHMKSKAHFKRCSELGVSPGVASLSNGDGESDMGDETATSESEDDETDEENELNGTDELEREAISSLLSLSSTPRISHNVSAGLLPRASSNYRPPCYPYTTPLIKTVQTEDEGSSTLGDDDPIDLSQKDEAVRADPLSFLSKDSQFLTLTPASTAVTPTPQEPKTPVPDAHVPAYLAANIASTQEEPIFEAPRGQMLQAYLTAKALRDVQIKQKQRLRTQDVEQDHGEENLTNATSAVTTPSVENVETPIVSKSRADGAQGEVTRVFLMGEKGQKPVMVSIPSQHVEEAPSSGGKNHEALLNPEFFPPASGPNQSYVSVTEDGRSICVICNKTFNKPSQLRLHVNIHYFERPFRCESCAVSFRTKGHLQKHERSVSHHNKVSMNTTFGAATTTNPRPFKCDDCKIAFRIHGHLAKHLRSKMHIMKLECIGKLPFGTYAELERSGFNLNEIDTTDCDNSLESLQALAQKLYEKDSSKFGQPPPPDGGRQVSAADENAADWDSSSSDGVHTESVQCAICGEPFDSPAALQVHMFADHNREMVLDKRKSED